MKKVLFVCVENSCRSQMAEAFANSFGRGIVEAYSAGSMPSGHVDADAVKVMQELNIDISSAKSKGFEELPLKQFDYAITLGCKDVCPVAAANKHIEWQIEDPKGRDIEIFRKVRDKIRSKVKKFIEELSYAEIRGEGGK